MTEFLASYHLLGIAIGAVTFLIIGLFHPIVVKGEYYFGVGCWWVFLIVGIAALAGAFLIADPFWSSALGVLAFSSFWSIKEVKEQVERVEKGWFPENPKRKSKEAVRIMRNSKRETKGVK